MGPVSCPETSVRNFHYMLRNSPENHSSLFLIWVYVTEVYTTNVFVSKANFNIEVFINIYVAHELET